MNHFLKKSLAFLLAFVMVLGVLPVLKASAATVNYETGYSEEYGTVIKNWGKRGELATFLSPYAEEFYSTQSFSYDTYVAMSGSSDTSTVTSSTLYTALYNLMAEAHTTISDYEDIRDVFQYTDCENSGNTSSAISGFYSGIALTPAWDGGLTWNREHTWPQSKSAKGDDIEDIMSIRPESSSVNSSRGNKGYGESSGFYDPNSVSDAYDLHGDVARVILYTYVRWGGESATLQGNMWGSEGVFESVEVLLQWMEEDPVDTWEMGRNDAVESVTGTRNVFVDYPELAFVLFGEEIPEMDTPSGNADSVSYTITARSNNSTYGTVSVNNGYVTAHPAEGYKATGYEVVSGSATVSQNGNIFTVSATGNCTIRILFAAKDQYTATFMEDGEAVSTQKVYEEYCVTMPAYSGTVPTGYTFRGWVDSIVYNTTAKPATVYAAGSECVIEGNTTFYALMSYVDDNISDENLTYKLVTSESQLSAGTKVVIAASAYDKALSTTQNTNNRGTVNVTKGTDTLIFDSDDGVQVLTLVTGTVDGTYGLSTDGGYLWAASNSSNWLRTTSSLNDNGSFKITVNGDGTCTVVAKGTNAKNNLQYNSSSDIFSCYSTDQKAVALYAGVSGGTTYYTMAWTYIPEDPTEPEETEPETTQPVEVTGTLTYVISNYGAGTSYAKNEEHKLDDVVTVVTNDAFFTKELRLYQNYQHDSTAVIKATQVIDSLVLNVGYSSGTLSVYGSADGESWTLIEDVTITSATQSVFTDYTVDMPEGTAYNYIKLDSTGGTQLRIKSFSVTFAADSEPECDHEYDEFPVTEATCTQPGSIIYICAECADNYTVTTAALGHSYETVTVEPTYTTVGSVIQTCSTCDDVITEEIPELENPVEGYQIVLGDSIGVNFLLTVEEDDAVVFTVNGEAVEATVKEGVYSINVAAAQMTDVIAIAVNGMPLANTYSVRGYADYILDEANGYNDATKNLVEHMLNYGAASQNHFGYNTANLANNGITVDAATMPTEGGNAEIEGAVEGILFYGASLVHRNKIAVRFYFNGSIDGLTFKVDETVYKPVEKNGIYYIEVADINPQELDTDIKFVVSNGTDSLSVSYAPMDYIIRMYNKADAADTTKALVQALYGYYLAAEAYIK